MTLEAPVSEPLVEIEIENTKIKVKTTQITSGMAIIPLISENLAEGDVPRFLDSTMIDREVFFLDDQGSYDSLSIDNRSNDDVIIPASTHVVGGKQNRGIDKLQLIRDHLKKVVDAHCFEPNRSHGSRDFKEIEMVPIDIVYQTMVSKGTGASWGSIEQYTKHLRGTGNSLEKFLKNTDKERTSLALNFETLNEQTGVISLFGTDFVSIELFPNKHAFNTFRADIYKGKLASYLWKKVQEKKIPMLTPSDALYKADQFIHTLKESLKTDIHPAQVSDDGKYTTINIRKAGLIADLVLNEERQIVYLFAIQKF